MSFVLRFRRAGTELGVLFAGFAHVNSVNKTVFEGKFRTFNLDKKVPAAGSAELQNLVLADVGDTGTGSGTQT